MKSKNKVMVVKEVIEQLQRFDDNDVVLISYNIPIKDIGKYNRYGVAGPIIYIINENE